MGHTRRKGSFVLAIGMLPLVVAMFLLIGLRGAQAETGMKALILGSTVSGGASSREATSAVGNGFTVTVVDNATWGAMTTAQFSDYQLIVIGDATCNTLPAVVSQNAAALADAVMDRGASTNTKVGNRVLIGTDPVFHAVQGGQALIDTSIDFAGVQEGASGLVLNFTCNDPDYDGNGVRDGQDKLLPLLTQDPARILDAERVSALRRLCLADRERRAVLDAHHREPAGLVVLGARDVPEVSGRLVAVGDCHGHADEADLR